MKRFRFSISISGHKLSVVMMAAMFAFVALFFMPISGITATFPAVKITISPDGDTTAKNELTKQHPVDDTLVQVKREIELEFESGKIIKAIVDGEEIPENSLRTHGFRFVDRDTTVMKRIVVKTDNPRFRTLTIETNSFVWQEGDTVSKLSPYGMQSQPKVLFFQQNDGQSGFGWGRFSDSLLFFMPEIDSLRLRVGALALDSLSRQRFMIDSKIDSILQLHLPRFEKGFPFEREKVLRRYVPDTLRSMNPDEIMELREREAELRRLQIEIARMKAGLEHDAKRLQTDAIQLEMEIRRKEMDERTRILDGMKLNIPQPTDQFAGNGREIRFILEKEQSIHNHGIEISLLQLFKDELIEQELAKRSSMVVLSHKQTIIDGQVVDGRTHRSLLRRFEEITGHKLEKGQAVTVR